MRKKETVPSTPQSLDKALNLLIFMAQTNRSMSISEIEQELGVSRPTAYSILNSLMKYDFIEKNTDTSKFSIGFRAFVMAFNYPRNYPFLFLLEHYIKQLHDKWKCRVNVTVFRPPMNTIKILSFSGSEEPISRAITGSLIPSYASGSGKVLLAALPDEQLKEYIDQSVLHPFTAYTITDKEALYQEIMTVRKQGYGSDQEELVLGNWCIAAPIYDSSYHAIATISVSLPVSTVKANLEDIVSDVKLAASRASSDLGYNNQPLAFFTNT